MLQQDGSAITYLAHNFVFEDKLVFGADSAKVVMAETARWNGNPTFDSRPPMWNVPGTGDQQAWSTIVAPARKASVWDGASDRFGYARVIVPEGAVVGNPNMQTVQTQVQTQAQTAVQNQVQNTVQTNGQQALAVPFNTQTVQTGTMPTKAAAILENPNNNVMVNTAGI